MAGLDLIKLLTKGTKKDKPLLSMASGDKDLFDDMLKDLIHKNEAALKINQQLTTKKPAQPSKTKQPTPTISQDLPKVAPDLAAIKTIIARGVVSTTRSNTQIQKQAKMAEFIQSAKKATLPELIKLAQKHELNLEKLTITQDKKEIFAFKKLEPADTQKRVVASLIEAKVAAKEPEAVAKSPLFDQQIKKPTIKQSNKPQTDPLPTTKEVDLVEAKPTKAQVPTQPVATKESAPIIEQIATTKSDNKQTAQTKAGITPQETNISNPTPIIDRPKATEKPAQITPKELNPAPKAATIIEPAPKTAPKELDPIKEIDLPKVQQAIKTEPQNQPAIKRQSAKEAKSVEQSPKAAPTLEQMIRSTKAQQPKTATKSSKTIQPAKSVEKVAAPQIDPIKPQVVTLAVKAPKVEQATPKPQTQAQPQVQTQPQPQTKTPEPKQRLDPISKQEPKAQQPKIVKTANKPSEPAPQKAQPSALPTNHNNKQTASKDEHKIDPIPQKPAQIDQTAKPEIAAAKPQEAQPIAQPIIQQTLQPSATQPAMPQMITIEPAILLQQILSKKPQPTKADEKIEKAKPQESKAKDEKRVDLESVFKRLEDPKRQDDRPVATQNQIDPIRSIQQMQPTIKRELDPQPQEKEIATESKEIENKTEARQLQQKTVDIEHKIRSARSTINHFVGNLREAIANYKPPITKIAITLNPASLGSVDVVLKSRGKNIEVKVTSNPQAVAMLYQHSAEFKQNLLQLGYSDANITFADGKERDRGGQNQQNQSGNHEQEKQKDDGSFVAFEEVAIELYG